MVGKPAAMDSVVTVKYNAGEVATAALDFVYTCNKDNCR
jgi:hypothetical protein